MRVVIFGSCVSRDVFDFVTTEDIAIDHYYARSSFASAFSTIPVDDIFSKSIQSTFQRRQVRADLSKTFSASLRDMNFDILLVDFTDERFPLFQLPDAGIITVSAELHKTNFPGSLNGHFIQSFSVEHFRLWEKGWENFIRISRANKFLHKIRINCALWSRLTEHGKAFMEPYTYNYIATANSYFKKIYRRTMEDVQESNLYRYDNSLFLGKDDHKWGIAPFHYVDSYYLATLKHLLADRLARTA